MTQQNDISNEWIKSVRPRRNAVDPGRPHAFLWEQERSAAGTIDDVATIFLTNRECPWRCVMCDLWKNTTEESVPVGAVPKQIDRALSELGARDRKGSQIKLYNSGSFFDQRAIPAADHPRIAGQVRSFKRVIVECHPSLINDHALEFRNRLGETKLEVAMGLETAHPHILEKLNKGITLDSFRRAADFLKANEIDLRVFVLVKTPWQSETEAVEWAVRSVEFAIDCHATVTALIPTRLGNGALEKLAENGEFSPPKLVTLESAFDQSLQLVQSKKVSTRVFADLWDLGQFSVCNHCLQLRMERMQKMNHTQEFLRATGCDVCGHGA